MSSFRILDVWGMVLLVTASVGPFAQAQANTFQTLYTFAGATDGAYPDSGLSAGKSGAFYGTTSAGGGSGCGGSGCGTIYQFAKDGTETTLYAFLGSPDGSNPIASPILDASGDLYGTASLGGDANCNAPSGCGTVYKLSSNGTETVLHTFTGPEGAVPYSPLLAGSNGTFFGTTPYGGTVNSTCASGCGTVYKVTAKGKFTVLYSFAGGSDGANSFSGLVADSSGNLYGTTSNGGTYNSNCASGCGTIFKLAKDGTFSVLYAFAGGADGQGSTAPLISDSAGNLYGTTPAGGDAQNCSAGCGTVFKLVPGGTKTILYSFAGGSDGAGPYDGLYSDPSGDLFGTTISAGNFNGCGTGCGTVFEITSAGREETLHAFLNRKNGGISYSVLVPDKAGDLMGTTEFGLNSPNCEYGCGTIYKIKP